MTAALRVRGNATPEELAAVLAVLAQTDRGAEPDRYTQWRSTRLAAVRAGLNDRLDQP